ncbi:MAG: alpha/beta fold hydrolase [Bdellovibrionales bacterium]|nr:alpha/beta fold hydrolase [Bdellovibrionales bacterium]
MTRIVCLHGFLGKPSDWQPVVEAFHRMAPDVQIDVVDIFSTKQNLKFKTMADWAKKFNDDQKSKHVERNILVGYSMGGRLALQAAIDKPGLWDEVILISSHPGLIDHDVKAKRLASDKEWADKFLNISWSDVVSLWNDQPVFAGSEEPERKEGDFNKELVAMSLVNWSLATQEFLGEEIRQLSPKLHWYAGEKDLKYRELFQALQSDGFITDFHIIRGAGHRVIFDKPYDFAHQLVHDLKL